MTYEADVRAVLADYGQRIGLPPVEPDDAGLATLVFGEIPITFELTGDPVDLLWIHAELGQMPDSGAAATAWLLRYNLVLGCKNIMTLALDGDGRSLRAYTAMLSQTLDCAALTQQVDQVLTASLDIVAGLNGGRDAVRGLYAPACAEPRVAGGSSSARPEHGASTPLPGAMAQGLIRV